MFGIMSGGKVELIPDKMSYALGETANVDVVLRLSKPLKARGLFVRIAAYEMRRSTHQTHDSHGHSHNSSSSQRFDLFAKEIQLDGDKEYPAGEARYKASFTIPQDPSLLGQAGFLGFIGGRAVTWEITGKLDMSMAFDVKGVINLNVH